MSMAAIIYLIRNQKKADHDTSVSSTEDSVPIINWEKRHELSFDFHTQQWFVTLHLPRGEYSYKYVLNNQHWVVNDEE